MAEQISNANDVTTSVDSSEWTEAHGEAALLLVESLIHVLVEHDVIVLADAVEITKTAIDVKSDPDAQSSNTFACLTLLEAIHSSLNTDSRSKDRCIRT